MSKILFIDDDHFITNIYVTKLIEQGIDAVALNSVDGDIVQKVADIKPDLISMDVIMPIRDGFDVTKMLKTDERTRNIPLVFLTNMSGSRDVEIGKELGALAYIIQVPYNLSETIEILLAYLDPKNQPAFKLYSGSTLIS